LLLVGFIVENVQPFLIENVEVVELIWGKVRKNWPKIKQEFYGFNINELSNLTLFARR